MPRRRTCCGYLTSPRSAPGRALRALFALNSSTGRIHPAKPGPSPKRLLAFVIDAYARHIPRVRLRRPEARLWLADEQDGACRLRP